LSVLQRLDRQRPKLLASRQWPVASSQLLVASR
jgi:hypothetical protein